MHYFILFITILLSCSSIKKDKKIKYILDLNNHNDSTFTIVIHVEGLDNNNNIFQFAATTPGIYQPLDIGRFVRSFKAYDADGKEITTKHISTNQFLITMPKLVKKIKYTILETLKKNNGLKWGSSRGKDYAFIFASSTFGYFSRLQSEPFSLDIKYPTGWKHATALKTLNGIFQVNDYDHIVDSPILLGKLSKTKLNIDNSKISINCFSINNKIKSEDLKPAIKNMLLSTKAYFKSLPIDNYSFIFLFINKSFGALEHKYSSTYIWTEESFIKRSQEYLVTSVAHEFLHIYTPLNLHSEVLYKKYDYEKPLNKENLLRYIGTSSWSEEMMKPANIAPFNFEEPKASQHIWLYEGVTEWLSRIIQLKANLITLKTFLNGIEKRIAGMKKFSTKYSLIYISLNSYASSIKKQYQNVYYRGALVACLLDIYLLKKSDGKMGLQTLLKKLLNKYNHETPFNEEHFFKEIVELTMPEVKVFIEKYIKDSEYLPIKKYFSYIGVQYNEEKNKFTISPNADSQQINLRNTWMKNR